MRLKNLSKLFKLIKFSAFTASLLLLATPSYAYFCSGNGFNGYINVGDTAAQVAKTCGTPTSTGPAQDTKQVSTIEYWTYSNEKLLTKTNRATGSTTTEVHKSGPMLVMQITNGKVSQITANGNPVKNADCSTGRTVFIGAKSADVMLSCGNPSGVTTTHGSKQTEPTQKIISWTYDYGQYRTPLILEFTNGKLSKIGQ